MEYWLDLFTGTTWGEFRDAGARISGFRHRMRNTAGQVQPGDVFLCYMTGVQRWVGALEVVGPSSDTTPIWKDVDFPVRFEVKPLIMLDADYGVPMDALEGQVDFYAAAADKGKFKGFVRMTPNRFRKKQDGEFVTGLLREAEQNPVRRPVDPKKFARKPFFHAQRHKGEQKVDAVVSVPESDPDTEISLVEAGPPGRPSGHRTQHTETQFRLLELGADMGLDVWVARNDRSKSYGGRVLGEMPRMLDELPTQFNEVTNRTIELIDVLWLKGNSIVAAFEIECTTSVYSGLLRMSDLMALQPNLDISLYLVAPEDREAKVQQEILRPTFSFRPKPLGEVCGFIPIQKLVQYADHIRQLGLAESLNPEFLATLADYFGEDEQEIAD